MSTSTLAWSGKVISIADGDTTTVLRDKERVRIWLYGIDILERGQEFRKRAKQFTSKLVCEEVVEVKVMATDSCGRTAAMIYADKTLFNEELVKAGLAWIIWQYCHHPICKFWKNFQISAKMDKRRLRPDPDPMPPWQFRRKKRSQ